MGALGLVRAIVGAGFVLVAPGLAWSYLFFPRRPAGVGDEPAGGLDPIQRLAVAFGLSVALVPSGLFLLNEFLRMPLNTWTVSAAVLALAVVPLGILGWRRRRLGARMVRPDA